LFFRGSFCPSLLAYLIGHVRRVVFLVFFFFFFFSVFKLALRSFKLFANF